VLGADVKNIPTGTHNFSSAYVEPALVYELSNLWNGVQQLTFNPEYTSDLSDDPYYKPTLPLVSQSSTVLTGEITFISGYNFDVNFNDNVINLTVASDRGLILTCSDEFIPTANKDCNKIVSFINGVPPNSDGILSIRGGTDIVVTDGNSLSNFKDAIDTTAGLSVYANTHTIFIGMNFDQIDLCAPVLVIPPTK
jgi:hypothetical protein